MMELTRIESFRIADRSCFVDRALLDHFPRLARELLNYRIEHGHLRINSQICRDARTMVRSGDEIIIDMAPEPVCFRGAELEMSYRDGVILAVNKPAGLASVPSKARPESAEEMVLEQLRDAPEMPILLHRLDSDTSGLLLFALNGAANRELAAQFANREIQKSYLALVPGEAPETFSVEDRLFSRPGERTVASKKGKAAHTDFRRLCYAGGISLVEAKPHTGRTHQIRVHLADAGFPILGDTYYGGQRYLELEGEMRVVPRQLLHARKLEMVHPGLWQPLCIEAPLPEDFLFLMNLAGIPAP